MFLIGIKSCLWQNRRWSPAQAREFLHLHSTLALITLQSDLGPQRTHCETLTSVSQSCKVPLGWWFFSRSALGLTLCCHLFSFVAPGGFKLRVVNVPSSSPLLPLHTDILTSLFTPEGQPYLLEVTYKQDFKLIQIWLKYTLNLLPLKTGTTIVSQESRRIRPLVYVDIDWLWIWLVDVLLVSLSTRWCLPCVSCPARCLSS